MGSGSSKKKNAGDGEPTLEKLREWKNHTYFWQLDPQGQEQFRLSLSEGDRQRLKFYQETNAIEHPDGTKLDRKWLENYILDGEHMLKDVKMSEPQKEKMLDKFSDVTGFLKGLREEMRPDLDVCFEQFQKQLQKRVDTKLREAAAAKR